MRSFTVGWMVLASRRKMLLLATCHSGIGKSRLAPHVRQLLAGTKGDLEDAWLDSSQGSVVLAAAAKGQAAYEDPQLKGDVYSHFFLKGLQLADRNQDGAVSSLEAHDYARERTYSFTKGRQTPTALAALVGDGDVILSGKRSKNGLPVLEAYGRGYEGLSLRTPGSKGALPAGFALQPGYNRIEVFLRDGQPPVAEYDVYALPGERITLEKLIAGPKLRVSIGLFAAQGNPAGQRLAPQGHVGAEFKVAYSTLWDLNLLAGYRHYPETSNDLGGGVESSWQRSSIYLGASRNIWQHFAHRLALGLVLVREQADLTLAGGAELSRGIELWGLDPVLSYSYRLRTRLQLFADLHWQQRRWSYGNWGELDSQGWHLTLGAGIGFH